MRLIYLIGYILVKAYKSGQQGKCVPSRKIKVTGQGGGSKSTGEEILRGLKGGGSEARAAAAALAKPLVPAAMAAAAGDDADAPA